MATKSSCSTSFEPCATTYPNQRQFHTWGRGFRIIITITVVNVWCHVVYKKSVRRLHWLWQLYCLKFRGVCNINYTHCDVSIVWYVCAASWCWCCDITFTIPNFSYSAIGGTTIYLSISHSYRFSGVNFERTLNDNGECLPKTLRLLDSSISTYSFTVFIYVYCAHIFWTRFRSSIRLYSHVRTSRGTADVMRFWFSSR